MKTFVEYVLFDMDGLMIDSEQVYTDVTNTILGRFGKEMTWDIKAGCMGKPERPATEYLLSFFPDIPITVDEYIKERRELQDKTWSLVQPLPGVLKLVEHLAKHHVPIAVATGSMRRNYNLKTAHLPHLFDLFAGNVVCGDDEVVRGHGKPEPDVFLAAAKILGRQVGKGDVSQLQGTPEDIAQKDERSKGLIFEDATMGVESGRRAGMKVIWVPDERLRQLDPDQDHGADAVLASMLDFKPDDWGLPAYDD